ncbi:hypothetical protein [Algivirga pacifica]|uniref:Uncharacterized protein n=1 Tax=Algivirga pacifica TaxID=1162670 RepID=A0ABP9DD20_9BACT
MYKLLTVLIASATIIGCTPKSSKKQEAAVTENKEAIASSTLPTTDTLTSKAATVEEETIEKINTENTVQETPVTAPEALNTKEISSRIGEQYAIVEKWQMVRDFNGDQKDDIACVITNTNTKEKGVAIMHHDGTHAIIGAGDAASGVTDMPWLAAFQDIPRGNMVAPYKKDEKTGKWVTDYDKEVRLIGAGIWVHEAASNKGGIIYWDGEKYEWIEVKK